MTKIIHYLSILLIGTSTVFAQAGSGITVEPVLGVVVYDEDFIYQKSTSFGLALSTPVTDKLSTGLSYKTSSSSTIIDMPVNNPTQHIRWHLLQLQLNYDLIYFLNVFEISPSIGIGGIHFTTPAIRIDLGALGSQEISSRSSTHFAYSMGLLLRIHLLDRFSILVNPGGLFFNNSENSFQNFFIDGGLSIEIG